MSAVKTLALGVLVTGSLAASAFGATIKHGHHEAAHPALSPTTLVVSAPSFPLAPVAPVAPPVAAPAPTVSAENLALSGGGGGGSTGFSGGYGSYNSNMGGGLSLGTTASPSPAPASAGYGPAPSYSPSGGGGGSFTGSTSNGDHAVAAFINFGNSGYSESQALTTGTPQAWYTSPAVQHAFGGTPNAGQQASFINEVLQTIHNTYASSGLNVSLTTDPTRDYAHTMSVVSGASYKANADAIGITDVGNDGFSFIDKFGQAKNADELATAIGHNLAHEMMHAFGIASHPDQTGTYLDAATASWSMLTNPNITLSPQAAQMLAAQDFLSGPGKEFTQGALGLSGLELLTQHHPTLCNCPLCQAKRKLLQAAEGLAQNGSASPVPEPTTMALWGVAAGLALIHRRRQRA